MYLAPRLIRRDMKIVIAGAGDVGFHLAKLLSTAQQEITLIDLNEEELEYAANHLDVQTVKGDASSIEVLNNASIADAKLFLALTTNETTNLITCILAKKIGAKQTIARVSNSEYLSDVQRENFKELGIDHLISPLELAANEVFRLVKHCEVTDHFEFEGGTVTLGGVTLDNHSNLIGRRIGDISSEQSRFQFKPIAVLRNNEETIVPTEETRLEVNDHIYFVSPSDKMNPLLQFIGKELKKIKNIMILGGTPLAMKSAKLLEKNHNVTIVEKEKTICKRLVEKLDKSLVIKGDPSNIELLKEEGLDRMHAVIALTGNSETNIIACLTAEKLGVFKTIALVDNTEYTHISQHIGVDTLINKKLIAASNIFRFVRKGKIEAITALHGVDAEIIEYLVHKNNQLTKKALKDLPLPKQSMIALVIRDGESIIPNPDFQLCVNDKVIVLAAEKAAYVVDRLFK